MLEHACGEVWIGTVPGEHIFPKKQNRFRGMRNIRSSGLSSSKSAAATVDATSSASEPPSERRPLVPELASDAKRPCSSESDSDILKYTVAVLNKK